MDTAAPSSLPTKEPKRRQRWEGILILIASLGVFLFAVFQSRLPQLSDSHSLASNIVFVLLINLNIILLVLLVFLVGRNLIKLFYERQRKLPGAYLRFRLVLAFVAISLLPAILLFLIGVGFVNQSIDNWFSSKIETSLGGALTVVDAFYDRLADEAVFHARGVATEIGQQELTALTDLTDLARRQELLQLIDDIRQRFELGRVLVFAQDTHGGQLVASAARTDRPSGQDGKMDADLLDQVFQNEAVRQAQYVGQTEIVRGGVPLIAGDGDTVIGAVIVEYTVPPHVAWQGTQVTDAFREYRQLRILKQPIKNNYLITMFLVTLVAVFSAVWLGFFLAKKIAIPLQQLAAATREVAQGHWTHRLEGEGEDEVGTLVAAFNRMTTDLQQSHQELEARRRYMEILLANINAGVVSFERTGMLSTMNRAAQQLLGVRAEVAVERDYREVFVSAEFAQLRDMIGDLLPESLVAPDGFSDGCAEAGGRESQGQLRLHHDGQAFTLLVTATPLTDEHGDVLGGVCFFEDVTQIIRVERMEAWREVACRIAHEIKNPLTPIQLAAQRLQRRFASQLSDPQGVFNECVQSITYEVDAIKKLVNEFSTFARLPTAEHQPEDLNALIQEVIIIFSEAHRDLDFKFVYDLNLPPLDLDREGMKRVVRNLLENAVVACRTPEPKHGHEKATPGRLEVVTRFFRSVGIARLEVADTGCGIPPEVKDRLFEPYFSTKKDGTGLGLAIVATIVADHQAFLRVRDNTPQGSRFVIELPVRRRKQQVALSAEFAQPIEAAPLTLTGTDGNDRRSV
jgi:two-component system nitrogen regulation sensor histidine kinase NtrY